jgi:type III restriction enzyme
MPNLYETIGGKAYNIGLSKPEIPEYILNNLKYSLFDWQKKALENFLTFQKVKEIESPNTPTHLMFNMATGTGKTLLIASAILYYCKQGYRHFIFFVNQNNIVDKTENNFIDSNHTKYLYKDKIVIGDKTVKIRKVDNFSDNPQGIEIKFTTIQKLYNDIHLERENQTTLEDLHSRNFIMLADEAHHLNTDTTNCNGVQELDLPIELTNRTSEKEIEKKGWEHTVINLILNKNGNCQDGNKNVLLEFTATIPANEQIDKKYSDKIIHKFGLKEFLSAGYTKEINLIASSLGKKERILQALMFHWYRHKIAIKYNIPNFKPVILFRSKFADGSKEENSFQDMQLFLDIVNNIKASDFDFMRNIADKFNENEKPTVSEMGKSRSKQVLDFIKKENISYAEIAKFIKNNFHERNVIITNSKTNKTKQEKTTEEQEKLLNSLEDKNNHIRAIFTVQRLTEGWDVLNLFDIVRLYEGRDEGKDKGGTRKAGSSTTAEKQLIGRGVRYFPFEYKDTIKNKRKFDNELDHELRVLEELYFYSVSDHRYIDELKRELKNDGYIKDDRLFKTFAIKNSFKESNFYKKVKIWKNSRIDNPGRKKNTLKGIQSENIKSYKIKGFELKEEVVDFNKEERKIRENTSEASTKPNISKKFKEIEKHIVRKAINIRAKQENSIYQFKNLSLELNIESIDDLQKDEFLGDFEVAALSDSKLKYEDIKEEDKLQMVLAFLDDVFNELKENIHPYQGSKFSPYSFESIFSEPKTKIIEERNLDDSIADENEWYVLDGFAGTDQERALVSFIKQSIDELLKEYTEVYLLRNEEVYKIYNFKDGKGFQPDFILFLKNKKEKELYYQIFIEPKGGQFEGYDGTFEYGKESWKEEFLEEISKRYGFGELLKAENKQYRLIGLPFFNKDNNSKFEEEYQEIL